MSGNKRLLSTQDLFFFEEDDSSGDTYYDCLYCDHGGRPESDYDSIVKSLLTKVSDYCVSEGLLARGDTIVAAVSGGLDSAVLLDILCRLAVEWDLRLHIAHLNHGLRGDASEQDAAFVETLGRVNSLTFHGWKVDCRQSAALQQCSLEEACRKERFKFLQDVTRSVGADKIATGHHADDQAETVLMRLLRGSGTTGLAGIRPIAGTRIRPLLTVDRNQIEAYAHTRNLKWRVDASNIDLGIHRNRIRHQLIPILKSDYGSRVPEAIARAGEILQADDDLLESIALDASKTVICARSSRKIALDGSAFFGYHVSVQRRVIRAVLTQLGFSPRRVEFRLINRLLAGLASQQSKIQVASELIASYTGRLIILGTSASGFEHEIHAGQNRVTSIDANLDVEEIAHTAFPASFADVSPFEIWFDCEAVPENLVLRTIRTGDRMRPFGSGGSAKVSDILINRKVPRLIRDEVPVLANQDQVFWIVGIRASETSRISPASKQAVRFRFDGSWRTFYAAFKEYI
jgi:tRNA(Ile)-lysidine synthase